jgi:hypothetical protein
MNREHQGLCLLGVVATIAVIAVVISVARSTAPTQAEKDRGIAQRADRIKEFWLAGEHDEMTFAVRAASPEALEILFSTQQYGVLGTPRSHREL